jgi:hypothetical protein
VKAALARFTFGECADLATEALRQRTTSDVRALLAAHAEESADVRAERVLP